MSECVGEAFCASLHLTNEEAYWLAADACLSWWQKRYEMAEADDMLWEMSENRIDELACDPQQARVTAGILKDEDSECILLEKENGMMEYEMKIAIIRIIPRI